MEELLLSLAQLAIAILLSAIGAFLAMYMVQWFTRDIDEWLELKAGNAAIGIVLGAATLAAAILLRPALVVDTRLLDMGRATAFFEILLTQAFQLAIGLLLTVITLALALYLFAFLTRRIDEVAELKKGNLAMAGLLAGVIIGVSLMVSQSIGQILSLISSFIW